MYTRTDSPLHVIQEVIDTRTADEWIDVLPAADVPASRVNSVERALVDEQTLANDMVVEIDHPAAGALKMLGIPYRFSDTTASVDLAPPLLGADTDAILKRDLGLDEATIANYRDQGVI